MVKKKFKPFVIPTFFTLLVLAFTIVTFLLSRVLKNENVNEPNYLYVSYEILMDNSVPVISTNEDKIVRPYNDETVKIGKTYYDYKNEENQSNSIIYYGNTYIQNLGVDYTSDRVFNVMSILPGVVVAVTEDDIVGKTIQIRHDNEFISTYQSLSEIIVKENDKVGQGEIIGKSGTNEIGNELGNHLHLELFYKNELVNPEEYFDKSIGEF